MTRTIQTPDDGPLEGHGRPGAGRPPANCRALLISGDPSVVRSAREAAASVGRVALTVVDDGLEARDLLAAGSASLLMVHLAGRPADPDLLRLVREARRGPRPVGAIAIVDEPAAGLAPELLRLGVADCLTRPVDPGRLAYLLDILALPGTRPPAPGLPESDESGDQVGRIARSQATLLIGGEPGTGKTRMARTIHDLSARRDRPYLVVDCGSRPVEVIERELFGPGRAGKLAEAVDGTLFLDNVDALPMGLQVRLLKAVEDRAFGPAGPGGPAPGAARLIAASGRPLEVEVAEGRFRADLFYRLNVLSMTLPPLRSRAEAIPRLAREFLREFSGQGEGRPRAFSPEATLALGAYPWPGNIRELRDVVGRAVTLAREDAIAPGDLPEAIRRNLEHPDPPGAGPEGRAPDSLAHSRQESERRRIEQALANQQQNRVRTARELGISRVTLYRKLRKYGLLGADEPE